MAYSTATGADIEDFMTALKDFADGQGWTIGKWDTSDKLLFLEKGVCHAAMRWVPDVDVTDYQSGSPVTVQDDYVLGVLGSSLDNSKTASNWAEQPDQTVAGNGISGAGARMNNLAGPFTAWHLFSDADGSYIHAVVRTGQLFSFLSFGTLHQGELTHGGVAYISGTSDTWWKHAPGGGHPYDYVYADPGAKGEFPVNTRGEGGMWYAPDALPAGFPTLDCHRDKSLRMWWYHTQPTSPYYYMLDHHRLASAPTWSSWTPLFGIPFIARNSASDKLCCAGFFPDIRVLMMDGMLPGQELDMSGDTWKVFPRMRQTSWSDPSSIYAASSGQYALAFKKIT
jgi:hypothetical protein